MVRSMGVLFLLGHLTSLPGTTKMGVEWTVPQSVFWWVGH